MENLLYTIEYGEIILPDNIHVAVGRQLNLWWSTAAVYEEDDRSVYFEVKCDIGITAQRGFVLKPTEEMIGEHTFTVRSRELHTRKIISEKTLTIHVVSDKTEKKEDKNILMIGDSRTWHSVNSVQGENFYQQGNKTTTTEVKRLLNESEGTNFNFVGTKVSETDSTVRNLADNGWCYSTALETINEAGGIVPYIENACGAGIIRLDYVTIMYGINDFADWHQNNLDQYDLSRVKFDSIIANAKALIDEILSGYPECKIVLVLEPSTSGNQDGFGYWGASDNDCQVEWEFAVKALRKKVIAEFDNGKYSKNVTLSTAGLWCDRVYAYPYLNTSASDRTPEATVLRLINCAHPHDNGYRQIADGDFSTIKYLEQK